MFDLTRLTYCVEQARMEILQGRVLSGIDQIHHLKKNGHQVDVSIIEDIVDLPSLMKYLYDETFLGDAITATRCLAALKDLDYPVDRQKINYIRYKKLSMMGLRLNTYYDNARPAFASLLRTLRSFFAEIGDYRECMLHKTDARITFEEDVIVRFANESFRDLFLQIAFQQAIEFGLSFHWENHHSILNQELTGRLSWSLIQPQSNLPKEWYHGIKGKFDEFIRSLIAKLETLDMPRYFPSSGKVSDLVWVIFSRDYTVGQRISSTMRNYATLQIQDLDLLEGYLGQDEGGVGAFICYVSFNDFDVISAIVRHKLTRANMGAPVIIFAEPLFFKVVKDRSLLFPGCEFIQAISPENIQNLEFTLTKVQGFRRRFVRLPLNMECEAALRQGVEHTRATPVSPGGTFIKTHKSVPVFTRAEVTLRDPLAGFEDTFSGRVIYNAAGGTAVEFDNLIPFDKFQRLRDLSLDRHRKVLDTLKRSRV